MVSTSGVYSSLCKKRQCCDCCKSFLASRYSILYFLRKHPDEGVLIFEYLKKRVEDYADNTNISGFWMPWCLDELDKCISCLNGLEESSFQQLFSHFNHFLVLWQDKPGKPTDVRLAYCPFIDFEKLWGCVLHPQSEFFDIIEDIRGEPCKSYICNKNNGSIKNI